MKSRHKGRLVIVEARHKGISFVLKVCHTDIEGSSLAGLVHSSLAGLVHC